MTRYWVHSINLNSSPLTGPDGLELQAVQSEVVPASDYDAKVQECEGLKAYGEDKDRDAQCFQAQVNTLLDKYKIGKCLKCNADELRTSCLYPSECEHPGRELALKLNQSLLNEHDLRQQLAEAEQQRDTLKAQVEQLRNDLSDALDMKAGHGPTVLIELVQQRDTLKAQLADTEELCRDRHTMILEQEDKLESLKGQVMELAEMVMEIHAERLTSGECYQRAKQLKEAAEK